MSTTVNNKSTNAVHLIADSLKATLHDVLVRELTQRLVDEFKESATPVIKEHVERVVLSSVTGARDVLKMRDEIQIYLEINGGE